MISHLLWLQLPFLYLPLLVVGLAIYGADFEHPSGRIYLWTPVVLALLHWILRLFGRALARRAVAATLLIACAVVVAIAYRPLHMAWWDERSTAQAVRVLAIGVCSALASQIGAYRVNRSGGPRSSHAAASFAGLALLATAGMLYPMFALLALAPLMATGAAVDSEESPADSSSGRAMRFGGWQRYALLLFAIEASLPLWDFQTDPRWALFLGLGLLGAALGSGLSRRYPFAAIMLPVLGTTCVIAAVIDSDLVVSPTRAVCVGAAVGWLLSPLFDAPTRLDEPARLSWCTPLWMLGFLLGFVLSANRAFMGFRLILWLPLLVPFVGIFGDAPSRYSSPSARRTT